METWHSLIYNVFTYIVCREDVRNMDKFTIVDIGGNARDIPYLIKELRQKNLIVATEKRRGVRHGLSDEQPVCGKKISSTNTTA